MRFWDSSAVVPLVVEERRSARCRAIRRVDRSMLVWILTRTEVVSALHRLARERRLDAGVLPSAVARLDRLARGWSEVEAIEPTRERAERALAVHVLSAADALQLGAALVAARDRPRHWTFVTADGRLGAAASAEGFDVIVPAG
jgi:uncharacterized protein